MRSSWSNQTQPVLGVGVGSFPSVRRDRQDGDRLRVVGFQFGTDAFKGETWFIYFEPRSASNRVSGSMLDILPAQVHNDLILLRIAMPSKPAGGKAGRLCSRRMLAIGISSGLSFRSWKRMAPAPRPACLSHLR